MESFFNKLLFVIYHMDQLSFKMIEYLLMSDTYKNSLITKYR